MSSITEIISNVVADITPAKDLVGSAYSLYEAVAGLISEAETAYSSSESSGAEKKDSVLASLKTLSDDQGLEWEDVSESLSEFIDAAVDAYNAYIGGTSEAEASE